MYANAEVEEAVDSHRDCRTKRADVREESADVRRGNERMAFLEAIIETGELLPIQLQLQLFYPVLSCCLY